MSLNGLSRLKNIVGNDDDRLALTASRASAKPGTLLDGTNAEEIKTKIDSARSAEKRSGSERLKAIVSKPDAQSGKQRLAAVLADTPQYTGAMAGNTPRVQNAIERVASDNAAMKAAANTFVPDASLYGKTPAKAQYNTADSKNMLPTVHNKNGLESLKPDAVKTIDYLGTNFGQGFLLGANDMANAVGGTVSGFKAGLSAKSPTDSDGNIDVGEFYKSGKTETEKQADAARDSFLINSDFAKTAEEAQRLRSEAGRDKSELVRFLGDTANSVGDNLSRKLVSFFAGNSPISDMVVTAAGSYSSAYRQARQIGADENDSGNYALLSAAIEGIGDELIDRVGAAGEGLISGSIGKTVKGYISSIKNDNIRRAAETLVSNTLLKYFGENILGEGAEEGIEGIADVFARRATYDKNAVIDWKDIAMQAASGALTGGVLGAANIQNSIYDAAKGRYELEHQHYNSVNLNVNGRTAQNASLTQTASSSIHADSDGNIVLPAYSESRTGRASETADKKSENGSGLSGYTSYAVASKDMSARLRTYEESELLQRSRSASTSAEKSGILLGASEASIEATARLERDTGVEIEYFSAQPQNGTSVNGYYKDGKIYVNTRSGNPTAQILAHELTHALEGTNTYEKLKSAVNDLMRGEGTSIDVQLAEIKQTWGSVAALSDEDARREAVARYVETKLLSDEESIRATVQRSQSLGKRILAWIERTVQRLTGQGEKAQLEWARAIYARALREYEGSSNGAAQYSFEGYDENGVGKYKSNYELGTPKYEKSKDILKLIQDVWSKTPVELTIERNGKYEKILAQFDPYYDESENVFTDASKISGGNKLGNASDRRVTLNLGKDYLKLLKESKYAGTKPETGKSTFSHQGVKTWHYFVNDILFAERSSNDYTPYTVTINVKEKNDGNFVYSYSAEAKKNGQTPRRVPSEVNNGESSAANVDHKYSIAQNSDNVNNNIMINGVKLSVSPDAPKNAHERSNADAYIDKYIKDKNVTDFKGHDNVQLTKRAATMRDMLKNRADREATVPKNSEAVAKLGIKIKSPLIENYALAPSLIGNDNARRLTESEIRRFCKKYQPTDAEKAFARDIADKKYTLDDIPSSMDTGRVNMLYDLYTVYDSFKFAGIKAQRAQIQRDYDKVIAPVVEDLKSPDTKKPSAVAMYADNITRNNIRYFGNTIGKRINDELFHPVEQNSVEQMRFVNREYAKLAKYKLSKEESRFVQMYMEGAARDIDMTSDGLSSKQIDKVHRAADTLKQCYNEYYLAINDFLAVHGYEPIGFIKDYAPHMQEKNMSAAEKIFKNLGFDDSVSLLPSEIAGRTENRKPGKSFDPHFLQRKGKNTEYDAVKGFSQYVDSISNVFYHTDDIMKLRRFNESVRALYAEDTIKEEIESAKEQRDKQLIDEETAEARIKSALDKVKQNTKYGDYVSALDDYTNILARKQGKLNRSIEAVLGRGKLNIMSHIQTAFVRSSIIGNLSSALNQLVQIPMIQAEIGGLHLEHAMIDMITGKGRKLGIDSDSNYITGKHGINYIDKTAFEKGLDIFAIPFETIDDFASRLVVRAKYFEQISRGAGHKEALDAADKYAYSAIGSRVKGGKALIFENGNPIVKLITTFQLENSNAISHITKDIPNSWKLTKEEKGTPAAVCKAVAFMVRSILGAFLWNRLYEEIDGQTPVPFDIAGIAAEFAASGNGLSTNEYLKGVIDDAAEHFGGERILGTEHMENDDFDFETAASNTAENVIDDMPYVSNAAALLGYGNNRLALPSFYDDKIGSGIRGIANSINGEFESDEDAAAAGKKGIRDLAAGSFKVIKSWIPLGNQIYKTVRGLMDYFGGGEYDSSGKLMYQTDKNPLNAARAALFGPSALPENQSYWARGGAAFTEAQTKAYELAVLCGTDPKTAYELVNELRGTQKSETESALERRRAALSDFPVKDNEKATVYYELFAKNSDKINGTMTEKQLMDKYGKDNGKLYSALNAISDAGSASERRTALLRSDLSDDIKRDVYINLLVGGDSDSVEKKRGQIQSYIGAGMDIDDFIRIQNVHSLIYNGDGEEKKEEFISELKDRGYSIAKIKVICESFNMKYSAGLTDGFSIPEFTTPSFDVPNFSIPKF